MGRAGWLRGLLLVACLAGGDAYVVPTSQHVLQLAARRTSPPPPRAPSTTATVSDDYEDAFDKRMKVRRVQLGWSLRPSTVCAARGWGGGYGSGEGGEGRASIAAGCSHTATGGAPRSPSTRRTCGSIPLHTRDEVVHATRARRSQSALRTQAYRRERIKNEREMMILDRSIIASFIACLVYIVFTTP